MIISERKLDQINEVGFYLEIRSIIKPKISRKKETIKKKVSEILKMRNKR